MSPQSDRGFCSGDSEIGDDRSVDSPHSQIDIEDTIEVKIPPTVLLSTATTTATTVTTATATMKNKRKCSEPLRVVETDLGPLKKRIRYDHFKHEATNYAMDLAKSGELPKPTTPKAVFRPWTVEGPTNRSSAAAPPLLPSSSPSPAEIAVRHPGVTTLHRVYSQMADFIQDEPLALVKKKSNPPTNVDESSSSSSTFSVSSSPSKPLIKVKSPRSLRGSSPCSTTSSGTKSSQRNYKNMTRERRIEANARERSRVHTISAAYDTLRKSIPSYSSSQKLSKLAVLRIACAYILTLSRMNGEDLSADQSQPDIEECIERVKEILQAEGKVKKSDSDDE